jgi:hypothetical protein
MPSAKTRNGTVFGSTLRLQLALSALALSLCCQRVTQAAETNTRRLRSLTQYGITWTFDREVEVGQFVNGDYYVIGACTVVEIDPAPVDGRNGSTINLGVDRNRSPFDDRAQGNRFDAANYQSPPIVLKPNDSLISSVSVNTRRQRPSVLVPSGREKALSGVRSYSVLTCLPAAVRRDAFRPAYCVGDKTIYYANDLNRDLLPRLEPVENTANPDLFIWMYQRPWMEVCFFNFDAAAEYQAQYGRETSRAFGNASLLLCLDIDPEKKEKLLINCVQYGIDLWGIANAGYRWNALGGHGNGRKWPIVFAGMLLGDDGMSRPTASLDHVVFSEDEQTRYGKAWHGATVIYGGHMGASSPDDYRQILHEVVHPKDWPGNEEARRKWQLAAATNEDYRRCCTSSSWVAAALAMRLMDAEDNWNHPAFFDYVDRWMTEDDTTINETINAELKKRGIDRGVRADRERAQGMAWDRFTIDMWEKYRPGNPRFVRDPGFRGYELRFPTAPDEMGFLLPQP